MGCPRMTPKAEARIIAASLIFLLVTGLLLFPKFILAVFLLAVAIVACAVLFEGLVDIIMDVRKYRKKTDK